MTFNKRGRSTSQRCGCNWNGPESVNFGEAWTELEAWIDAPETAAESSVRQMPAILSDIPEWVELYSAGGSYQDSVRTLLGEDLDDSEINALIESAIADMTPEEAENFFRSIGRALQGALPVLSQIGQAALPVAGAALGSFIPIPGVGTALGGALGKAGADLLGRAAAQQAPRQTGRSPSRVRQSTAGGVASASSGAGNATAQLLSMLTNPDLLRSLAGVALGGRGGGAAALASGLAPLLGQLSQLTEAASTETAAMSDGAGAAENLAASRAQRLSAVLSAG